MVDVITADANHPRASHPRVKGPDHGVKKPHDRVKGPYMVVKGLICRCEKRATSISPRKSYVKRPHTDEVAWRWTTKKVKGRQKIGEKFTSFGGGELSQACTGTGRNVIFLKISVNQ